MFFCCVLNVFVSYNQGYIRVTYLSALFYGNEFRIWSLDGYDLPHLVNVR